MVLQEKDENTENVQASIFKRGRERNEGENMYI
jgi:hypothetical protein